MKWVLMILILVFRAKIILISFGFVLALIDMERQEIINIYFIKILFLFYKILKIFSLIVITLLDWNKKRHSKIHIY